jgi:hypothetical protein
MPQNVDFQNGVRDCHADNIVGSMARMMLLLKSMVRMMLLLKQHGRW